MYSIAPYIRTDTSTSPNEIEPVPDRTRHDPVLPVSSGDRRSVRPGGRRSGRWRRGLVDERAQEARPSRCARTTRTGARRCSPRGRARCPRGRRRLRACARVRRTRRTAARATSASGRGRRRRGCSRPRSSLAAMNDAQPRASLGTSGTERVHERLDDERADECGDRRDVLKPGLRVHLPQLERAMPRMQHQVPPEKGRVGEAGSGERLGASRSSSSMSRTARGTQRPGTRARGRTARCEDPSPSRTRTGCSPRARRGAAPGGAWR